MSIDITLQRSPHDSNHPYSMISNDLIDNMEISNELKMLLIYCVRKPDNWVFQIEHLIKCMDLSRRHLYRIIDEGIKNGYIFRPRQDHDGHFKSVKYFFSESPIFKKCSPCAKTSIAGNVTPSLYNKTEEYLEHPTDAPYEKAPMRDDIEALPFSEKDKRSLSKYPREAIAHASYCLKRMKQKPPKPIAVFTNLCKGYMLKEKLNPQGEQRRSQEDVARAARNKESFSSQKYEKLRMFFSIEGDNVVAKYGGKVYSVSMFSDLFEEEILNVIGKLYDQINLSS